MRYFISSDGTLLIMSEDEDDAPVCCKEITEYEYNDLMLSGKADEENDQIRDENILERK